MPFTPASAKLTDCFDPATDTAGDYTNAFGRAFSNFSYCYVPVGTFKVTGSVVMGNGNAIRGEGRNLSIIASTSTTQPVIKTGGTTGCVIQAVGITSWSGTTPTGGGHGIDASPSCSTLLIRDVKVWDRYDGLHFQNTDYSVVEASAFDSNYHHGVLGIADANVYPQAAMQFNFLGCGWSNNDGYGFLIYSASGTSGSTGTIPRVTLGSLVACSSYANGFSGVAFLGSAACPIYGARILGGFFGEDAYDIILLDSYGDTHTVRPDMVEKAGTIATGRNYNRAATNQGSGLVISANNNAVQVSIGQSAGNSFCGMTTDGSDVTITGGQFTNNGVASNAGAIGYANGIFVISGRASITGVRANNRGQVTSGTGSGIQKYGLKTSVDNLTVVGNDFAGNATASTTGLGAGSVVVGNRT